MLWRFVVGLGRDSLSEVSLTVIPNVELSPKTSLALGGRATHFVEARDEATVIDALRWADQQHLPVLVLGGGSNLVIGDDGWDGLVLHVCLRGIERLTTGPRVRLWVAAGEPWEPLVSHSVLHQWAGLECLSGIPGSAGATPIQNVGAYGCEISERIVAVHVWDRRARVRKRLTPDDCGFGYRDSAFKRDPGAVVVLAIELELIPGGAPTLRYGELVRSFEGQEAPSLAAVRDRVLALRRGKSMVIDPADPNRRSAGSFFTNPVVDAAVAQRVVEVACREGLANDAAGVPQYPAGDGLVKLAAGWLIEAAGLRKGQREGAVGISTAHALALVHHGGGTTAELVAFARGVRDRVRERFGIELRPEPVFAGVDW